MPGHRYAMLPSRLAVKTNHEIRFVAFLFQDSNPKQLHGNFSKGSEL